MCPKTPTPDRPPASRPWLTTAILAAVILTSILTEFPAHLPVRLCIFRNLTGIPCPACGMTRGFVALGHARLAEAWRHNPLAPPAWLLTCACLAWSILRLCQPARRAPRLPPNARALLYACCLAAVVLSWSITLPRL